MQTISRILMEAGTLEPGFHIHIDKAFARSRSR